MNVTVCEISDREDFFIHDWIDLELHLVKNKSNLLLLPDLAFFEWTDFETLSNTELRQELLSSQASWILHLERLSVDFVVYSKLVFRDKKYFKACYLYRRDSGHQQIRQVELIGTNEGKLMLQQQESSKAMAFTEINGYKVSVILDTELWRTPIADHLSKSGADILLCPRASGKDSVEQWIRQGQAMAVLSGAYCLSSNKTRSGKNGFQWGGRSWIAEPFTGKLLGSTNNHKRFLTCTIDMKKTRDAKSMFPINITTANF
jgi:predicted amidohydrolase